MRYPSHSRNSRSSDSSILRWIILSLGGIVILFFIYTNFIADSDIESKSINGLTLSSSGKIVITNADGKKRDAETGDIFSQDDTLLTVISGNAMLKGRGIQVWLDKGSEFSIASTSGSGVSLNLGQGRAWIEADQETLIKLKHIDLSLNPESIALVEQQQRIYSIAYMMAGNAQVDASGGRQVLLTPGKGIKVSQSDLVNPGTTLAGLVDNIDDSIKQNPFFLAHNGQAILEKNVISTSQPSSTSSGQSSGAIIQSSTSSSGGVSGKYISIKSPLDGSIISGTALKVEGTILSPLVKKIMVNDKQATITSATNTFSISNIAFSTDTIDLVYKAYDESENLLERGVITIYSEEKKQGTDKLIPTTFPVSDKLFRILSPNENPFKTNTPSVTVSGTVPKNTVEYITVNNFRLKKFVPKSSNWYYYANISYGTMKEGFNLYEIKFYAEDDSLLSTQLFTIIKEGGNPTLSGE